MTKSSSSKNTVKNVVSAADQALLEEHYEFVPSTKNDKEDDTNNQSIWQDRMVQRYNEGLYREFALADLSRPGQLGLRWRTRQEVVEGRGEETCGNKRCFDSVGLVTMEVPFAYQEGGTNKKELVKLRLCPTCLPQVRTSKVNENKASENGNESSSHSSLPSHGSDDPTSKEGRKRRKRKNKSKSYRKKRRKSTCSQR